MSRASVTVDDEVVGEIGTGLCLLVGVGPDDDRSTVEAAVDKIVGLRVFSDPEGKMNLSVVDVGGEVMVVSQFTLLGDARRGRRPSFTGAASPEAAEPLIRHMVEAFTAVGLTTRAGVFGARMQVDLVNEGPVTLILEF